MEKMTDTIIKELLRLKPDGSLFYREQKDLEFKESFNLNGLAEYLRDFSAFANNSGGYIIFGVTNSPRKLKGLSKKSLNQFKKIDAEKISGFINEHFVPYIDWIMDILTIRKKSFGILYIDMCQTKPVICKKGDPRQILKNGEIYYRYAGRTEVIQYSELARIIENRIKDNNEQWLRKVKKIGEAGPSNVGILDTTSGIIEGNGATLLIDDELVKQIKFIREGDFSEKKGARTLKLVGSVQPIGTVEIAKVIKKRLTDEYPYSYRKLEQLLKLKHRSISSSDINSVIRENDLKSNADYAAYNFRNKDKEEEYNKSKIVPRGTNSIYNDRALEFIIKVLSQQSKI